MAYCVQGDIDLRIGEARLIQLTDDGDDGAVDTDVLDRAIADADEEIDSYLSARYALPFDSTPNRVRTLSVDITVYNLYKRRKGAPEHEEKAYKDALSFLKDVARGLANLDVPDPSGDDDGGPEATTAASDRIFSRGRDSDSSSGTLDNY